MPRGNGPRTSAAGLVAIALALAGCAPPMPAAPPAKPTPDRLTAFREFRDCRDQAIASPAVDMTGAPMGEMVDAVLMNCAWELARLSDALDLDATATEALVRPDIEIALSQREVEPSLTAPPIAEEADMVALREAAILCLEARASELDDGFSGARSVGEAVARRCFPVIEALTAGGASPLADVYADATQEATLIVLELRASRRAEEREPLAIDPDGPAEEEV